MLTAQQVKDEIYPAMRNYAGDLDILGTIPEIRQLTEHLCQTIVDFGEPG